MPKTSHLLYSVVFRSYIYTYLYHTYCLYQTIWQEKVLMMGILDVAQELVCPMDLVLLEMVVVYDYKKGTMHIHVHVLFLKH